jgi:1-acyl-sn-glycerol-3-phosphate acyltransferase
MRRFGTFPVSRRRFSRSALRQALQVLDDGLPLVMFPEGKRSRNGKLEAALPGAALIACRSGVPIIPVGISGTKQVTGITWILRRPRITVNIGRPFYLTPPDGRLTREELAELANSMMKQIAELLPREYRGNYRT